MSDLHPVFQKIFDQHFPAAAEKATPVSENVARFQKEASSASYHFADDSAKEWGLGYAHERTAQAIYDASTEEEKAAMRPLAGLCRIK